MKNAVIIGSNGQFGRVFTQLLINNGVNVVGMDREQDSLTDIEYIQTELPVFNTEKIISADLIIFCVPEVVVIEVLPHILKIVRRESIIADICSVKSRIHQVLIQSEYQCGYVGLHPMFAPSIDFNGQNVCIIPENINDTALEFLSIIKNTNCNVLELTATQHDKTTALVQVLPHACLLAMGSVLKNSDIPFDSVWKMSTPIMKNMLAMLMRVAGNNQLTHHSIQADNPEAVKTRNEIINSLNILNESMDYSQFEIILKEISQVIHKPEIFELSQKIVKL